MAVLLVSLVCGGCRGEFEANAYSVPKFKNVPSCRDCWNLINTRRAQLDLPAWEAPADAYPVIVDI